MKFLLMIVAVFCTVSCMAQNIYPLGMGTDGARLNAALQSFGGSTFTIGGSTWDISDWVSANGPIIVPTSITTLQGTLGSNTTLGMGVSTSTNSLMRFGSVNVQASVAWSMGGVPQVSNGYTELTGGTYNPAFQPSGNVRPQLGDTGLILSGNQSSAGLNITPGSYVAICSDHMVTTLCATPNLVTQRAHLEMLMVASSVYNSGTGLTTIAFSDTFRKTFPNGNIWFQSAPTVINGLTINNLTFSGYMNGSSGTSNVLAIYFAYNLTLNNVFTFNYMSGGIEFTWDRHITTNGGGLNSGANGSSQQTGYGWQWDGVTDITVNNFTNSNPNTLIESVFIIHNGSSNGSVNNSIGCACDAHGMDSYNWTFTNCNYVDATIGNNQWEDGDTDYNFVNCNISVPDAQLYPYTLSIFNRSGTITATGSDWGNLTTETLLTSGHIQFPSTVNLTGDTFTVSYNSVSLPKTGSPSGLTAYAFGTTTYGQVQSDMQWEANGESSTGIGSMGLVAYDGSNPSDVIATVNPTFITFAFTEKVAASPPTISITASGNASPSVYVADAEDCALTGSNSISFQRIITNFVGSIGNKFNFSFTNQNRSETVASNNTGRIGVNGTFSVTGLGAGIVKNLYSGSNFCNIAGGGTGSNPEPVSGTVTFSGCKFYAPNLSNSYKLLNFESGWDGNLTMNFNGCTLYGTNQSAPSYSAAVGTQYTGSLGSSTLFGLNAASCIINWTGVSGSPNFASVVGNGLHGLTVTNSPSATINPNTFLPQIIQ